VKRTNKHNPCAEHTQVGDRIGKSMANRKRNLDRPQRNKNEWDWSPESYRMLFEMVKDGIFVSTAEGKIINVNPSLLEIFGDRSTGEILKLNLANDIHVKPKDRKKLLKLLEKEKFVRDYEIQAKRRDGIRIIVWPGNTRELQNTIEHAVVISQSNTLNVKHLPLHK
jgi:PAS domain S-box-containing protein